MTQIINDRYVPNWSLMVSLDDGAQDHFEMNEWNANRPDFLYDNYAIWDSGNGVKLLRNTEGYYFIEA